MKNIKQHHKSYVTLSQRITGIFTLVILLLQICLPTVAAAAYLISDETITQSLTNNFFQKNTSSQDYLYKKAEFSVATNLQHQNIATFHQRLVAAKISLPSPSYIPIAGDITLFVPTYPVGKLVGDEYVQNRLIRQQIYNQLGRHMINPDPSVYSSEIDQINKLYNAAFIYAQSTQKIYGKKFTVEEAANLQQDLIWPEYRLVDGVIVVVPILYLSGATLAKQSISDNTIEFFGATNTFGSVTISNQSLRLGRDSLLQVVRDLSLSNSASIKSEGNLALRVGGNTAVVGSIINADSSLNLRVGGVFSVIAGQVVAANNVNIHAGQVELKTQVHLFTDRYGKGTRLGPITKVEAGGNVVIKSDNNIQLEAATINATSGGITLAAGANINILPVTTQYQGNYTQGDWEVTKNTLNVIGSQLSAQETIKLIAEGEINISASELISTQGGIELLAGQGIHILDELNQTSIQKSDRRGKTQGNASEFRTSAVRAVLSAGKGVLLDSEYGDVVLRATKINTTEGTNVSAKNGKVHLLMTKELEEAHLQTTTTRTWTIKTRTEDIVNETNLQNAIVGGLQVQAMYGIDVEYTGVEGATLKEQIEEYRKMPGMEWMADLYDQALAEAGPNLNWAEVEEIHKEFKKTKRNLSPAAMAIIAICVAVAMGPAGAQLIGSGGTGIIGGVAGNATVGAALNAGALTLATQATQSLAAGNSLRATLSAMDSSESLKALAVSMATAGAMQAAQLDMFSVPEGTPIDGATLIKQAGQAVVNSTVTAGVSIAINGGNTDDFKRAFRQSLVTAAVNSLTKEMAKKIGEAAHLPEGQRIDVGVQYIAHAAVGCLRGSLTANINGADAESACYSGAGGAIIGEAVGKYFASKLDQDLSDWTKEQLSITGVLPDDNAMFAQFELFKAQGADLAQLSAAFVAFAAGGDVDVASGAGMNAAQNNALNIAASIERFRKLKDDLINWWATPSNNLISEIGQGSNLFAMALYDEVNRKHQSGELTEAQYEYWIYVAEDRLAAAGVVPVTNGDFIVFGAEVGLQLVGVRYALKSINGKPTLTAVAEVELPPVGVVLDKRQRLTIFNEKLSTAPVVKNADDALAQLTRVMDEVEDAYSGVKKIDNPGLKYEGRMYAPRADYTTKNLDGSIEAITSGNVIKISPKGDVTFYLKNLDGSAGKAVLFKAGEK